MRELVVTPSFSSGVNSQLYLASFSLRPNDLRKYIYGGLDYPICFKSKCFDEKFRAELSNHAEVLVDLLIEKKSKFSIIKIWESFTYKRSGNRCL